MTPLQFYQQRLEELKIEVKKLQQRKSAFAWLRLGAIFAIIIGFYFLWSMGIIYVIVASVLLLFIFTRLIYADLKNQSELEHANFLIRINEDELKCLAGNYYDFDSGWEHIPKEHSYANDLDIFGRASLFQYINRTTSEPGSERLAEYLKYPASIPVISERQTAIGELSSKVPWIQNLQANSKKDKITFSGKNKLETWIKEPLLFSNFKPWEWLRYLLPIIILSIVTLFIFDVVGYTIFYLGLLIFAAIAYQI
ncbi:MAG: hypothetical protein ABIR50_11360, partial [Ginsengibacter sp.]